METRYLQRIIRTGAVRWTTCLLALAAAGSVWGQGVPTGAISHWSADNTAVDSMSGNNGTLMNGATYAPGKVNQAFSLNGTSSYVQIGGSAQITGARSYAAWVYPQASTFGMPVLAGGAAGSADFLSINGTQLFVDHWWYPQYVSRLPVTIGTWNHIALTYDGSGTIQFYVNGVAATPIGGQLYNYSVGTLEIGGNTIGGSTTGPSFNGLIDEVYLYPRALTAAEVQELATVPSIGSLNPASGPVSAPVTITGSNFGANQNSVNGTVTFNGVSAAPATNWTATSITVNVPYGATTGPVVVTVGGVASSGVTFTVIQPPSLASLNPASGGVGTPVTITGSNFGANQSSVNGTVTFNGVSAAPATNWSATSIVVNVPFGATTGPVVVTANGMASNGLNFTVLPTPSIGSLNPASGGARTQVTITGANFGANQSSVNGTVTFNGASAGPATNWSATSIVVNVPNGAWTGPVVVTVNGVASNGVTFTWIGPPPGATSYWSADNTAVDGMSGNNGTLMNGATYAPGEKNQAFSLNGTNSYVQIGGSTQIAGARSYAAWVYPQASTFGMPVLAGGAAGSADFLSINGTQLFVDHWWYPQYVSSLPVTAGTWNHIALTYDGSGTIQFYVNGVAAKPISGSLYNYSVGTLEIGGNTIGGSTTGPSFNGLIDEVWLYPRALTASEVKALSLPPVSTPAFNVGSGTYSAPQSVSITVSNPSGASVRYTTDGTTPGEGVGTAYPPPGGTIPISTPTTLKAIAYLSGWADSAVATAVYTFPVSTPAFNETGGNYASPQSITLSAATPAGASIRYTTDGVTIPTESAGTPYQAGAIILVASTTTIKAIAYAANWADSAVASRTYTITVGTPTLSAPANQALSQPTTPTLSWQAGGQRHLVHRLPGHRESAAAALHGRRRQLHAQRGAAGQRALLLVRGGQRRGDQRTALGHLELLGYRRGVQRVGHAVLGRAANHRPGNAHQLHLHLRLAQWLAGCGVGGNGVQLRQCRLRRLLHPVLAGQPAGGPDEQYVLGQAYRT